MHQEKILKRVTVTCQENRGKKARQTVVRGIGKVPPEMVRGYAPWILSEEKDGIESAIGIKQRTGIGAGIKIEEDRIADSEGVTGEAGARIVVKAIGVNRIGVSPTVEIEATATEVMDIGAKVTGVKATGAKAIGAATATGAMDTEVRVTEAMGSEVRDTEVRGTEVRVTEARVTEARATEVRATVVRAIEVRAIEVTGTGGNLIVAVVPHIDLRRIEKSLQKINLGSSGRMILQSVRGIDRAIAFQ
jgi:hypothetical protein